MLRQQVKDMTKPSDGSNVGAMKGQSGSKSTAVCNVDSVDKPTSQKNAQPPTT